MTAQNDPEKLKNMAVSTTGFVYKDETMTSDQFAILRFVITCCAADAQPIGVLVESQKASKLKNDQWVRVEGRVQLEGATEGKELVIVADTVKRIARPKDQYLY